MCTFLCPKPPRNPFADILTPCSTPEAHTRFKSVNISPKKKKHPKTAPCNDEIFFSIYQL